MPADRPLLRTNLQAHRGNEIGSVILSDPFRLGGGPLEMSRVTFDIVRLFNGERTLEQVGQASAKLFGGRAVPEETLRNLLDGLDRAMYLVNARLEERLTRPDRPPSCIGCYDEDPAVAREQLRELFTESGLPGAPGCRIASDGEVRAVLLPHMDYGRGGVTYGHGFKELVERTDASLFVVIATSHFSPRRFSLTRQNFTSPLGRVETDQAYVDRIVAAYGDGLFDDPFAHVSEHSIELEVVGMQFAFGGKPFRIVPLLVGSFFDCVEERMRPSDRDDVARMVAALRSAEAAAGEKVCYVISGDLAHIGPKFDDDDLVSAEQLAHSKSQDERLIEKAVAADGDAYFDVIADEQDARRICGLPPTYLTLAAVRPRSGKLLHYGRYEHPEGFESVSFASMCFQ